MSTAAHFNRVIQDRQGNLLAGAEVSVCAPGTINPITDPLYADEALTLPLSNPFSADQAVIDFYLASPRTVRIMVAYQGQTTVIDYTHVLPNVENMLTSPNAVFITGDPSAGKVLGAIGGQQLTWVDPPLFGGAKFMRTTSTANTASLGPGLSDSATTIPLAPGYRLYRVQTSYPARVRLYESTAARDADLARPIGTDPASNTGVVLDYVTPSNAIYNLSPLVDGANLDTTSSSDIPMCVTNLDAATRSIAVTLTYLPTEDVEI